MQGAATKRAHLRLAEGPATSPLPPSVLRVEELAQRWQVDRKTIHAMIARGELRAMRVGRLFRIPLSVVLTHEQAGAAREE